MYKFRGQAWNWLGDDYCRKWVKTGPRDSDWDLVWAEATTSDDDTMEKYLNK